ncbi:lipase 3 [Monomorium pharaonis]|uniref:lipase 3 n=1 Tax=Monomorium pharaonis TaxID=307658 RepID=UPI00063F08D4|nr:lipase 3 [Monomorium pharaonis]
MSKTTIQDKIHMTTPEMIEAHGYIAETYQICTEDDYYLTVHRVLSSNDRVLSSVSINADPVTNTDAAAIDKNSEDCNLSVSPNFRGISNILGSHTNSSSKLPVIINHGLLSCSKDWVLLGPQKALPYVLCDSGFDVWLTNSRGNIYSKSHKYYSTKDKIFWNFSWHEIGYYDLPATIDYILEKTGYSKLYYIGHSQGTTVFYVMASERPEYNAKIAGMISLAPAAFLSNTKWGLNICNKRQIALNKLQNYTLKTIVSNTSHIVLKILLNSLVFPWLGFNDQIDEFVYFLITEYFPAGSSIKQLYHYFQIIISGSFEKYNYGAKANLIIYGSTKPPKYILKNVNSPIAIFYCDNDLCVHPIDVKKLADNLPNLIQIEKIAYEKFSHQDFIWGHDARTMLYNDIVTLLKKF